ncbi:MAG: NADPH:quinone oxidoreductase family protein [Rhodospirillaceae bacterium]
MRALLCNALGSPDDLVETTDWTPVGPGLTGDGSKAGALSPQAVRIAVKAAGVNFADGLFIAGKYQVKPTPPFVPGFEVAGDVLEVGAEVTHVAPGDRVMAVLDQGGWAEEAIAAGADVLPLPEKMDYETAAGFPITHGTSHFGLWDRCNLQPGEVLVVHGAAGGVGLTAVECGKAMGATVIATAGGPEKLAVALEHGADHGIDYKTQDVRAEVKRLTGGRGADVVYDPVGGEIFDASVRSTAPDGRILVVGFASGTVPSPAANILLVKNISVIGFQWGPYRTLRPQALAASLQQCLDWWAEGKIRPLIGRTFPLTEAAQAIKALRDRCVAGKIVLVP